MTTTKFFKRETKQKRFYIWTRNFIRSKYGPQTFCTVSRYLVMRDGKWTAA